MNNHNKGAKMTQNNKKKANILTEKDIRDHIKLLLYKIKPSWWPKSYDELIHGKDK